VVVLVQIKMKKRPKKPLNIKNFAMLCHKASQPHLCLLTFSEKNKNKYKGIREK